MAPHSSTLAWKIPWTEEPGGLQSMGLLRVGHDLSDLAAAVLSTCNNSAKKEEYTCKIVHQITDFIFHLQRYIYFG